MSQRVPEPSLPIAAIDLHEQPLQRGFPKWDWRSLPFLLMHAGAVVLPFFTTFSWNLVALAIGLYLVRMFALTGFYHRYFSHRSFKTSRAFQFVMAVWGLTCVQKGPLWWAANHRHHHKHSDQHGDVHSPGLQGFIWAHMGWIMGDDWHETNLDGVPDLVKYPELRWLDTYHLVPGVTMGVLCYLIGGFPVLVWGFIVSTVINWHVTFMINSLTHMFGRRRYPTKDDSRNSFILALLTLGEGWHNNHHYYQSTANQGFYWWEIDLSYYVLLGLARIGVIWDLRTPPQWVLDEGRGKLKADAADVDAPKLPSVAPDAAA